MATPLFRPPADLTDFDAIPYQREAWNYTITSFFRDTIKNYVEVWVGPGNAQFFDAVHALPQPALTATKITWIGFPKKLYGNGNGHEQAWQKAEKLEPFRWQGRDIQMRPQDEYLEWHATRNDAGKITAVDFTCEGPEYWYALAHGYPGPYMDDPPEEGAPPAEGDLSAVLALYQRYVSPLVQKQDLLHEGRYDPYNKWNTELGAMHLTHRANTLGAEVNIAGDATVLREQNGKLLTGDDELIQCAKYGDPDRFSDPRIGGAVNGLARAGELVSLQDPVGLYVDSLNTDGWTKPDGSPVGDYWKVLRGNSEAIVRARYEVPPEEGFTVSDIQIGGEPIRYPGQIAEHITMKLTGVAAEQGQHHVPPVPQCGLLPEGHEMLVPEMLAQPRGRFPHQVVT